MYLDPTHFCTSSFVSEIIKEDSEANELDLENGKLEIGNDQLGARNKVNIWSSEPKETKLSSQMQHFGFDLVKHLQFFVHKDTPIPPIGQLLVARLVWSFSNESFWTIHGFSYNP